MNYEYALLGCIIIEPNQGLYACKEHRITVDSFVDVSCKVVFNAIESLSRINKPIDIVTVENALDNRIDFTISSLCDVALTIANVNHYAEEVKSAERRRELSRLIKDAGDTLGDGAETDVVLSLIQAKVIELNDTSGIKAYTLGDLRGPKIEQWELAQKHGFVGIPFHLKQINSALGGLRRKCMSILGGYRGEGKSTLARDWALWLAKQNIHVALFSLEDPPDIAGSGIAGNHADVNVFGLDTGMCNPARMQQINDAWKQIGNLPLWIMGGAMTIDAIDTTARLLKMKHGLDLIIIDHIQYIPPYIMKGMSRNDTVAYYSSRTTGMASNLDVHVSNLSQFSRDSEKQNRKPRLSDLRDSGTLEQDARSALLLYFDGEKEHHVIEVAKNNYGQSGVHVDVERVDGRQRFRELT